MKDYQGIVILLTLFLIGSFLGNPNGFKELITKFKSSIDDFRRWVNKQ